MLKSNLNPKSIKAVSVGSPVSFLSSDIFNNLPITSSSATLIRLAKEKFAELSSNDEYLYDLDKNTKDEVCAINQLLKKYNNHKLESLFYDELYEESDFVFFALDYVDEVAELEALLDSKNETLLLKTLTILKNKGLLSTSHKDLVLDKITCQNIKNVVKVL